MGKDQLDDYFWHCKVIDRSPLRIEPVQNPQSTLYRLSVIDKMGAKVIDFDEFDSTGVRREGDSLARALRAKGYEVNCSF